MIKETGSSKGTKKAFYKLRPPPTLFPVHVKFFEVYIVNPFSPAPKFKFPVGETLQHHLRLGNTEAWNVDEPKLTNKLYFFPKEVRFIAKIKFMPLFTFKKNAIMKNNLFILVNKIILISQKLNFKVYYRG